MAATDLWVPPRALPLMTRPELLAEDVTDHEIRWRLSSGVWTQVRFGVYIDTAFLESLKENLRRRHAVDVEAARLRLTDRVVASHESGAILLGVPLLRSSTGVRVTRPTEQDRHVARYRNLRVYSAELPDDQLDPHGYLGIEITGGARTAVDLGRTLSVRASVVTADAILRAKLATPEEVRAVLDFAENWPGAQRAQLMTKLMDGRRESALESESFVGFHECNLELPEPQVTLGDERSNIGRVDAYWRQHHTVGEADGMGKYADRRDKVAETVRQEELHDRFGVQVVRWRPEDIAQGARMRALCRRILAAFARAHREWGD